MIDNNCGWNRQCNLKEEGNQQSYQKEKEAPWPYSANGSIWEFEEGTSDANLCRKKLPEPTLQMEKISTSNEHDDKTIFEEGNADDAELGDMGDSNDEGAEPDIHNEDAILREV